MEVREIDLAGSWPLAETGDLARLRKVLSARTAPGEHWLVGNIVASAAPEVVREATTAGHHVSVIMHYFASDDAGLSRHAREGLHASEKETVATATNIIATSAWTAGEISRRYGRTDVVVALPGVPEVNLSPGSTSSGDNPTFLWLGRVTHAKDPLTFVEALASVRDRAWRARIVGPDSVDPACGRQLAQLIADTGLSERIEVCGTREGDALKQIWDETDLLVHTARAEAYGMVVTEALAHGIPSIVSAGTGAVEAQQDVGGTFEPGDAAALATKLRLWLGDPDTRDRWRAAAQKRRDSLPTWEDAARTVVTALKR